MVTDWLLYNDKERLCKKAVMEKYIFTYLLLTGEVMILTVRNIIPFLNESPQKNSYVEETELSSFIFVKILILWLFFMKNHFFSPIAGGNLTFITISYLINGYLTLFWG